MSWSLDEFVLLLGSAFLGLISWSCWYSRIVTVTRLASSHPERVLVYAAPLVSAVGLFLVLREFAAEDVRDDAGYLLLYQALGAAWVGTVAWTLPLLGLSARDDVAERRNRAAAWAISGAVVGATLCFAGGNIGDGPGWQAVVFSAGLSTGAWIVFLWVLERFSSLAEHITVERDEAAGIRLAAYLVSSGLILGRAVAGTWSSAAETLSDFAWRGWPVLVLAIAAAAVDRLSRPVSSRPSPSFRQLGALPAAAYLAAAIACVALQGAWT